MGVKQLNRIGSKKFIQVGVEIKCMHTKFLGVTFLVFEILLLSKAAKCPFQTIVHVLCVCLDGDTTLQVIAII